MFKRLGFSKDWFKARKRDRFSIGIFVAFIIALLWFLGGIASPFLIPSGTLDLGDNGVVGLRDNANEISEIDNGFAKFFYVIGDVNCHQRAHRSYFLNDNQMPFCARDTAIFLGLAVGIFVTLMLVLELNIIWIILGLVPIGVDGVLQLVTEYESSNPMRFITGILAGIVTGIAIGIIIGELAGMFRSRKKSKKSEN